jgi:two-component system, chemotaxis family, CheB/CheR fusion protein
VYVIAPDRQLVVAHGKVSAAPFDHPRSRRAAVDMFFRSLAATHGDGFAVLLSGSGSDGALGAKAVNEQGGLVLVQEPSEAGHSGMPFAAISMGVADLVLPARELAIELAELAASKPQAEAMVRASERREPANDDERALKLIFDVLRKRTGHDFSKYKRSTVLRRLSRRMLLARQLTLAEYLQHLRAQLAEVPVLFNDLLISVTSFFRDPEAWDALEAQVVEPLVDGGDADEPLRVWVPGCATGEEAYSLAILFHEAFERRKMRPAFTIFASDVDEGALAVAREGVYPDAIGADVSDSRLGRYFRQEEERFRVVPDLRNHLVLAAHSVLRDPPFARLHLISCRNVLIYLDRELQEQMMSIFQYACRDDAFLFLGASEAADEELFEAVDKRHRIFRSRPAEDGARPGLPDVLAAPVPRLRPFREPPARPPAAEVHIAALEKVAPPSVVVDQHWNVLHVSSSASRFFQQSGGPLARRLTDLVRPELRDDVHDVLQRAFESASPQLTPFVSVRFDAAQHKVAVLAQRRPHDEEGRRDILVTFLDAGEVGSEPSAGETEPTSALVRSLREKLRQADRRFDGMRDDHLQTMEDLRAANEELQSLNEEYRSTTEELETSKEELQSINEELHTLNHELKLKLEEVSTANSDLENLISATNVATLFLTADLRIKRFTPRLREIFKVQQRDLGRPIGDITHGLDYDLEEDAGRVLAGGSDVEREVNSPSGECYIVRITPYRTLSGRNVEGVVATFIDVTRLKDAELALRRRTGELEASQQQLSRQAAELQAQDRHREEFLAALGHELRRERSQFVRKKSWT